MENIEANSTFSVGCEQNVATTKRHNVTEYERLRQVRGIHTLSHIYMYSNSSINDMCHMVVVCRGVFVRIKLGCINLGWQRLSRLYMLKMKSGNAG